MQETNHCKQGSKRSGEEIRTPKKARKGAWLLDFYPKNLSQTLARISSPPNEIKIEGRKSIRCSTAPGNAGAFVSFGLIRAYTTIVLEYS